MKDARDHFLKEFKDSGMRSHVWDNVKTGRHRSDRPQSGPFHERCLYLLFISPQQAIEDAGLKEDVYQQNPRVGLIAGSGGSSKSQVLAQMPCAARAA